MQKQPTPVPGTMSGEEQRKYRLDICSQCPDYESNIGVCKKCGCWVIAKVWIPKARCPQKKW